MFTALTVLGGSISGTTQVNGFTVPVDLALTSRTGNDPTQYVASRSIDLDEGFESGVNDDVTVYLTDTSYAGGGNGGSGADGVAGAGKYRYGFNGKENDNEVKGMGDQIDYGARVYDPRAGRFLSVDPLQKRFAYYTPYQFSGNTPIQAIDLDGLEEWKVNNGTDVVTGPYINEKAAQNAVNSGMAKPRPPTVISSTTPQPVQKNSTFSEIVSTLHTVWRIVTIDVSQPIAAQPEATTPVGQLVEMAAPYIQYEKLVGPILGKILPETITTAVNDLTSSFKSGGTKLVSSEMLSQFPASETIGRRAETFISPTSEIDNLLSQGADRTRIAKELGIKDPDFLKGDLIRVDVTPDALKNLNLRTPTGQEIGANSLFVPGGKTVGGITEGVVNGIPKSAEGVSIKTISK